MTQTRKGARRWSYSTGERGVNRVRAFEHASGRLYLEFYEPRGDGERPRPQRVAVGHADHARAKAAAEELATKLRANVARGIVGPVTLATLFDMYLREVTPGKSPQKQQHDRQCARLFLEAFGDRPALELSRREWDRYVRDRRSGRLRPAGTKRERTVRDRVIAYDLRFLLAVLNWATLSSNGRGGVLLERNPCKGLRLPCEESPRRPVLSDGEYQRLLTVASRVAEPFRLALILAHETGHRIGAIRKLKWQDVDLVQRAARWRGENDKIAYDHSTPLTAAAVEALEGARRARPAIGDAWIFADDAGQLIDRHRFNDWWQRATALAELPAVERRGWHSLRRSFATDLKDTPLRDLCQLGGWKSAATVLTCYQQADEGTMRRALDGRQARQIAR